MKNCSVIKYKVAVNNSQLSYLFQIETKLSTKVTQSMFLSRSEEKQITAELKGDGTGYFTDSTFNENYGRKIVLPVYSGIAYSAYIKDCSELDVLIVNDYRYLSSFTVLANTNFDVDLLPRMSELKVLTINGGIISSGDFEKMINQPINTILVSYSDSTNSSSILALSKYIGVENVIWSGATGSHESIVEAWWNNGRRNTAKLIAVNTPLLTLNNVAMENTIYYKFNSDSVQVYRTKTSSTVGSDLLATYNGSVWTYN